MRGVGIPLNEERHRLNPTGSELIKDAETPPAQRLPGRGLARPRTRTKYPVSCRTCRAGDGFDFPSDDGEINQAGLRKRAHIDLKVIRGLCRIGRDDFKILT